MVNDGDDGYGSVGLLPCGMLHLGMGRGGRRKGKEEEERTGMILRSNDATSHPNACVVSFFFISVSLPMPWYVSLMSSSGGGQQQERGVPLGCECFY